MDFLAKFEHVMKQQSDDKFNESISKGALQLSDDQIEAVTFIFWMVYMAEKDLGDSIAEAWSLVSKYYENDSEALILAEQQIVHSIIGKRYEKDSLGALIADLPKEKRDNILDIVKTNYIEKKVIDIKELDYFVDKIKLRESFYGKTERTNLLWKLNKLRNDVSHGRLDDLKYEGDSLNERAAREKLLMDYMRFVTEDDLNNSKFWSSLTMEERKTIEKKYEEMEKSQRGGGMELP